MATRIATMKVTIMYRNTYEGGDGWTYYPVTVEISTKCPVCGGKRGLAEPHTFFEDGEWFTVDTWNNPCGHSDKYRDVYFEALKMAKKQFNHLSTSFSHGKSITKARKKSKDQ